ncbi:PREDICTED: probable E3 ubiquitin-protein ligase HERC4 isoform X2 [Nicrophorus vespilloides]|uniref:Probable E3 ubiquitin-protein ligase HERC4 isoform X2 n=1 Tax=Nicrophorus vespilloides TaxID=110193 RepID=A0ABM1MV44_NICVS|nr:PREDICTED: probable E3 ubiquitin-protein ligase HERC4 isoform X2 [Nicrophorus vespilloides]
MYAWGSTSNGELGVGGIEEENIYTPVELQWSEADKVTYAACGSGHTIFITNEGKLYSCGNNDYGQLGHGQPRKRPQEVSGLENYEIVSVACGSSHSMALNQWGEVFSWGSDSYGQLGHTLGQTPQMHPKIIKALATFNIVQIACGYRHSIALTNSGDILTWGANDYGQLGIGKESIKECYPTIVSSLSGIPMSYIACGGNHSFAVTKSGAVFGWGKNSNGQLGLNDTESKSYPCHLRTLRPIRVQYISCGENYSTFLTLDGGVFTCGAGMYGQLGHGTTSNEIVPRQVLELMGSKISQLQCGRQHTLALVPSRDRIYSFGLGGAGQLGAKKSINSSTPQIVAGPWIGTSRINRIFAGGDHCFAKLLSEASTESPYDCRVLSANTQILNVSEDILNNCLSISKDGIVDQETLTYLETVFKSLSCINGSFLLPNTEHFFCSSKHHGIDLEKVARTFSTIGKLENDTVKEVIKNCIMDDLLKKLTPSPPDVEALRVYITLPFYHEFNNPKEHLKLHKPFASSLLTLKVQATRVVESWWSKLPTEYYEKLVSMFKDVVIFIIRNQRIPRTETATLDNTLISMLNILARLNKLNHTMDGQKVPYDTFHIVDLEDYLDVRVDYVSWLNDNTEKLYLCNYPFLFDSQAKTALLEADQTIQMCSAMNQAAQHALFLTLLSSDVSRVHQYLMLNVSREHIVEDALRELANVSSNDLKKPLKVKFYGEEAEDAGGVRKEFFMLLLRNILDPKYGMFKEYEETRSIWFSEDSFEDEMMYFLIGLICGLAIYNFTIIDIPFPLVLYKKLLKEHVNLSDVKSLSPTIANSLQSLLDYQEDDLEEVFSLTFEISRDVYGVVRSIPLKPESDTPVTQRNKYEYVELYVDYLLNKSVKDHYTAFSKGFMKVCGGRVLELFHSHELMAVVVGNENYDWHALEDAADYKNGYKSSDEVIRWFWEVLHDMSLEDKKKFLLFLTGSDRIPIQGMKAIKIIFQPTNDDKCLPVAHTCFNLLDLPRYRTKERLKYKLLQAIQQTQGFSLV